MTYPMKSLDILARVVSTFLFVNNLGHKDLRGVAMDVERIKDEENVRIIFKKDVVLHYL